MKMNYLFKKILIKIIIILLIMIILYFAMKLIYNNQSYSQNYSENVFYIIDGDTFETSKGEIIRLLCVNTPERNELGYIEARSFLSYQILGKNLSIERQGIDKYNRTLAWVSTNSNGKKILINKEIIINNFGTLFEYNNTDCSKIKV